MKLRGIECALLPDSQIVKMQHGDDMFEITGRELRAAPAMGSTTFNAETMVVTISDAAEWSEINKWVMLAL